MAHSPSRVFAAVSATAGDVYRDENESVFYQGRKQTPLHIQSNVRVVQVTGCAEISFPPDRATVSISVKNSKENVNDVTNSVSRRLEYVLQTVRHHDVKVLIYSNLRISKKNFKRRTSNSSIFFPNRKKTSLWPNIYKERRSSSTCKLR